MSKKAVLKIDLYFPHTYGKSSLIYCMEEFIERLLPVSIFNELVSKCDISRLTEIRLRAQKPLYFAENGRYQKLLPEYIVSDQDIKSVLAVATKSSLYAYNSSILDGFISYDGGIRIGISGEGVIKNGNLSSIKNITSLCIRIPHYIDIKDVRINELINHFDNTLILSRPGLGKTTLLRYMIRHLSDEGFNILVLDERGELSGMSMGKENINLGECSDTVLGIPKLQAYASQVRSMRPDIIASDEIFGEKEVECILDCIRCGVKILATVHSGDPEILKKNSIYNKLLQYVRYIVLIKGIGNIDKIIDLRRG